MTRQVTITMSTPWVASPYSTSLYIRPTEGTSRHIADALGKYAKRHGVSVLMVDYSLAWGAAVR